MIKNTDVCSFKTKAFRSHMLHTWHVHVDRQLPSKLKAPQNDMLFNSRLTVELGVPTPTFLLKSLYGFITCEITAPERVLPGSLKPTDFEHFPKVQKEQIEMHFC